MQYYWPVITFIAIPILSWLILGFLKKALKRKYKLNSSTNRTFPDIRKRVYIPLTLFLILTIIIKFNFFSDFLLKYNIIINQPLYTFLLIITLAILFTRLVKITSRLLSNKFDISQKDNLKNRKIRTQLIYLERIVLVVIWILALAFILLSFENLQKYGKSILASAGVASIILGLAAQKSLGNFIAGLQIAFTQPIRIDDAVVIEGEWGWVEEITLTYIVIKIWDKRRLVLPITYVVEKPFQNWTRTSAQIIGTVYFHVNYKANIDEIRHELFKVLENTDLWDKDVKNLQVIELEDNCIKLRALMSAKTSPEAWDLRCLVREEMTKFFQRKNILDIPYHRLDLEQSALGRT